MASDADARTKVAVLAYELEIATAYMNDAASNSETDNDATLLARFADSRALTYERWYNGQGYDIKALREMSSDARKSLLPTFIPAKDWRDVEALIELHTKSAREALMVATKSEDPELRMAVLCRIPGLFDEAGRIETLIVAVEYADPFGALSAALDQVEEFHPAVIQEAMFKALLSREGSVAARIASSLAVIHGVITSRFDWSQRPLMLRFNTTSASDRVAAFLALYDLLNISTKPELASVTAMAASLNHPRT